MELVFLDPIVLGHKFFYLTQTQHLTELYLVYSLFRVSSNSTDSVVCSAYDYCHQGHSLRFSAEDVEHLSSAVK